MLLLVLTLALILLAAFLLLPFLVNVQQASLWQNVLGFLIAAYILQFFSAIFLSLALLIVWPFDFFVKRLIPQFRLYDRMKINYSKSLFEVKAATRLTRR